MKIAAMVTLETCCELLYKHDQAKGVYPQNRERPKCTALASFKVEGKPYCKRHAMQVVFDKLTGEPK
jgi:hypothetical protein